MEKGLINGTSLQVTRLFSNKHYIDCKVLIGSSKEESILKPHVKLLHLETTLSFKIQRI